LRRKARRYQYGAYLKGIGTRLRERVSVVEIRWGRVVKSPTDSFIAPFVHSVDQRTYVNRSHVRAGNGAEKSCRTRRKQRGLRRGKCRARGRHPREPPPTATNAKPPNLRKVKHRRRPEAWLVENSYTFHQKCKVFAKSRDWPCQRIRDMTMHHIEGCSCPCFCKACQTKKKMNLYLSAKWLRLHERSRQLGFPDSMAFDSSFSRYMQREFPADEGLVYERSILRGSFPFRWIDPIGDRGEELILPQKPDRVVKKKTLTARPRHRREDATPSIKCPYCGNRVFQTRPVCQKRSCGRSCREFFGAGDGGGVI
jgi:hypothetical protein